MSSLHPSVSKIFASCLTQDNLLIYTFKLTYSICFNINRIRVANIHWNFWIIFKYILKPGMRHMFLIMCTEIRKKHFIGFSRFKFETNFLYKQLFCLGFFNSYLIKRTLKDNLTMFLKFNPDRYFKIFRNVKIEEKIYIKENAKKFILVVQFILRNNFSSIITYHTVIAR